MSHFDSFANFVSGVSNTWWGNAIEVMLLLALFGWFFRTLIRGDSLYELNINSERLSKSEMHRRNHELLTAIYRRMTELIAILIFIAVIGAYSYVS